MTELLSTRCERAEAEVQDLRAVIARIQAAIDFTEPRDTTECRAAIQSDLAKGLSLRKTATKHGVTFGFVRGVSRSMGI